MSKLYELAEGYRNLMDLLENEEVPMEVIKEGLEQIEGDIEDKVTNMVRLIKNTEGDIDVIKVEEKRLSNRRKAFENKVKGIKEYMEFTLKSLDMKKVDTPYFTVAIQKNRSSVFVEDESVLNDKYFNIVTTKELNKDLLSKDLKSGVEVKGAKLNQSESLRIK